MRRAILAGTGVAIAAASLAACAAGKMSSPSAVAAAPQSSGAMPNDPRAEIDRLAKEIDDALPKVGVQPMATPTCAASGTCTAMPMAVAPIGEEPTCRPAKSETCGDICSLTTNICDNATKICQLAEQLGKADAYANEKCQSGNDSCSRSHERCCGCT